MPTPEGQQIDRRTALRAIGTAFAGALLAACGPQPGRVISRGESGFSSETITSLSTTFLAESELPEAMVTEIQDAWITFMIATDPTAAETLQEEGKKDRVRELTVVSGAITEGAKQPLQEYFITFPSNGQILTMWTENSTGSWKFHLLEPDPKNKPAESHKSVFGIVATNRETQQAEFLPVMEVSFGKDNKAEKGLYHPPTYQRMGTNFAGHEIVAKGIEVDPEGVVAALTGIAVSEHMDPTTMAPRGEQGGGTAEPPSPLESVTQGWTQPDKDKLVSEFNAWTKGMNGDEFEGAMAGVRAMQADGLDPRTIIQTVKECNKQKALWNKDKLGFVAKDGKLVWGQKIDVVVESLIPEGAIPEEVLVDTWMDPNRNLVIEFLNKSSRKIKTTNNGFLFHDRRGRETMTWQAGQIMRSSNLAAYDSALRANKPERTISRFLADERERSYRIDRLRIIREDVPSFLDSAPRFLPGTYNENMGKTDGWVPILTGWVKLELGEDNVFTIRYAVKQGVSSIDKGNESEDYDASFYMGSGMALLDIVLDNDAQFPNDPAQELNDYEVFANGGTMHWVNIVGSMDKDFDITN